MPTKNINIRHSTYAEVQLIDQKISLFNRTQVPFTQETTPIFANYVVEDRGLIIGGLNSFIYHWGILFIDVLFVDEEHRGKDIGTALLRRVETEAKAIGATLAHVDTFDFQAKDFYLKNGYEIFGVLDDCPKGHQRYYLKKYL